jgi:hypothetical protein
VTETETILVTCPQCHQVARAPRRALGRACLCPSCGARVPVTRGRTHVRSWLVMVGCVVLGFALAGGIGLAALALSPRPRPQRADPAGLQAAPQAAPQAPQAPEAPQAMTLAAFLAQQPRTPTLVRATLSFVREGDGSEFLARLGHRRGDWHGPPSLQCLTFDRNESTGHLLYKVLKDRGQHDCVLELKFVQVQPGTGEFSPIEDVQIQGVDPAARDLAAAAARADAIERRRNSLTVVALRILEIE